MITPPIIGIYKVTSPTGRIYIGQSRHIKRRWNTYKSLSCKSQPKIYASLNKYGYENHKFEILETCTVDQLCSREVYYVELYDSCSSFNLNSQSGGFVAPVNEETRTKISLRFKGVKKSESQLKKMSEFMKGKPSPYKGRKTPDEQVEAHRQKLIEFYKVNANPFLGKSHTAETKARFKLRKPHEINPRSVLVLNIETGIFYNCISEAAKAINIQPPLLRKYLLGTRKNKTKIIYA